MLFPIGVSTAIAAALTYAASIQTHAWSLHPALALMLGLVTAYAGAGLALCATSQGRQIIRNARRATQLIREGRQAA
jgi:hypothetical protein